MTREEAIKVLKKNRDVNASHPRFVEACNIAITAIEENYPLKKRCFVLSNGTLCAFCQMKCPDLGGD